MSKIIIGNDFKPGNRDVYEDRVTTTQFTTAGGVALSVGVVADGVGGEDKGETAAQLAVDTVVQHLKDSTDSDVAKLLFESAEAANAAVHAVYEQNDGASATLAVAAITDKDKLFVANIGDSRVYLCRGEKLTQLTMDHSFANVMVWQGKLTKEMAAEHPRADVLMRAVGPKAKIPIDLGFYVGTEDYKTANQRGHQGLQLKEGDSILVCTDGLIKYIPGTKQPYATDEEIIKTLTSQEGNDAAVTLTSFALGRNADDNVSVATLQMPDPKRKRRAALPLYRIAAVAAALLLASIVILYTVFSNRAEARAVAQEESLNATRTAEAVALAASQAELAATQAADEANLQATEAAFALTLTASEGEISEELRQTQEAIDAAFAQLTQQAIELQQTQEAEVEEVLEDIDVDCTDSANYQLIIEDETPLLSPPVGEQLVFGERQATATWKIANAPDLCPLTNLDLESVNGNEEPKMQMVDANGDAVFSLLPGAEATLMLSFEDPTDELDYAWVFVVEKADGDLLTLEVEPLTLGVDEWVEIVVPTVPSTPTATTSGGGTTATRPPATATPNWNATLTAEATDTPRPTNTPRPPTNTSTPPNTPNWGATQTVQAQQTQTRAAINASQTAQAVPTATPTQPPPTSTPTPACPDLDNDGICNDQDDDRDGDGIPNDTDLCADEHNPTPCGCAECGGDGGGGDPPTPDPCDGMPPGTPGCGGLLFESNARSLASWHQSYTPSVPLDGRQLITRMLGITIH